MNIADIILQIVNDSHVPMAHEVFGDPGLDAVFKVMETVKTLYRHIELERINGQIIVFQVVGRDNVRERSHPVGPPVDFAGLANQSLNNLCFEIADDGRPYIRPLGGATPEELAERAVVYIYERAREEFLAGSRRKLVKRYDTSTLSQFSVPTFSSLRDALQKFSYENVRESTCYIFRQAWHDPNRLFFKAKPESLMRNSLVQFLSNRLGGEYDIWPEQNVNEKNPVDIRVQTRFQVNRLMLVEIKWMGDSVDDNGHVTAKHRDNRAQSGAGQLANYLDEQRRSAPSHVIQGYYVIIDGRRRSLPSNATAEMYISRENGFHYETQEIEFDPAPHLTRNDFDPPYRMFARPVCND